MKNGWTATALLLFAATVNAQGQDALNLKSLAATCAACHGTEGRVVAGGGVPGLAGQPREALATQLRAFKAGTRPSTIMTQLSKGYTDAQIDQLAGYFSMLRP